MERRRVSAGRSRIIFTALVVWLALASAQFAIAVGLGRGTLPWWMFAILQAAHALAWTVTTLCVRLLPRVTGSRSRGVVIAAHCGALVIAAVLDAFVRRTVSELLVGPVTVSYARTLLYYADVTTLSYILAVWLGKVIDAREALIAHTRHELALRSQLARARLAYLHAQLQPHFLFNALGAVSELIFEDPRAAARIFRQLLLVLRAAASRKATEIPLREDIDGLMPYLEVQRTRFSDWLAITLDIDPAAGDVSVPPLILQPLVENSIRHGLRGRSRRGEVSITARVDAGRLVLSVRDNGAGLSGGSGVRRSGVGLSNTAERLRTLYGDDASVRLFDDELGGTIAEVSMPARAHEAETVESEASAPALEETRMKDGFVRRHPALALAAGCVIAGALWTQQSYAYLAMSGNLGEKSVLDILRADFFSVVMWSALVPVILWVSQRIQIAGKRWPLSILVHAGAVGAVSFAHASAVSIFRAGDTTQTLSVFRGSAAITFLLYLAVVAYGQRQLLERWLAERQLAALRLSEEISEANIAAATMSVAPESLDATLDAIEQHAMDNPLIAEQAVARLGNELRASLDSGSRLRREAVEMDSGRGRTVDGEDRVERLAMGA